MGSNAKRFKPEVPPRSRQEPLIRRSLVRVELSQKQMLAVPVHETRVAPAKVAGEEQASASLRAYSVIQA